MHNLQKPIVGTLVQGYPPPLPDYHAFHRVVNSHILRFAIAMRVYVRFFGAVTVWSFERSNIRNLLWQMGEYYLLDTVNISDPNRMCHETDWGI